MINKKDAELLARMKLNEMELSIGCSLEIREDDTIEEDFGWIFFWNSTKFLREGDMNHCIVGNGPMIVDKNANKIEFAGTGWPLDYYIQVYKRFGTTNPSEMTRSEEIEILKMVGVNLKGLKRMDFSK